MSLLQRQRTIDGVEATLLLLALVLVLFAPMLPAWWSFGVAGAALVGGLVFAVVTHALRYRPRD